MYSVFHIVFTLKLKHLCEVTAYSYTCTFASVLSLSLTLCMSVGFIKKINDWLVSNCVVSSVIHYVLQHVDQDPSSK